MSFWNTSDGKAIDGEKDVDLSSPGFDPIPKGTIAPMIIEEAKWSPGWQKPEDGSYPFGEKCVQITSSIIDGEFKNRKLWTSLSPYHPDKGTGDRHKQAMARLFSLCKVVMPQGEPTDADLSTLTMKLHKGRVNTYKKKNGEYRSEIDQFSPLEDPAPTPAAAAGMDDFDPDIPF